MFRTRRIRSRSGPSLHVSPGQAVRDGREFEGSSGSEDVRAPPLEHTNISSSFTVSLSLPLYVYSTHDGRPGTSEQATKSRPGVVCVPPDAL